MEVEHLEPRHFEDTYSTSQIFYNFSSSLVELEHATQGESHTSTRFASRERKEIILDPWTVFDFLLELRDVIGKKRS